MHNKSSPPTTPPTDVSDLTAALTEANIPTLMVSMAQISGDMSWLDGDERPARGDVDGTGRMSPEYLQQVRQRALSCIRQMLNGQLAAGPLPSDEQLQHLASFQVGEPVPMEYISMMKEEMGFSQLPLDSLLAEVDEPAHRAIAAADMHAVIIGCGISGICTAIHLKRIGIPFIIIEKNEHIGGTWYENNYPDCGVDTPNHYYSFSFEPNHDWTAFFAKRNEIRGYLQRVADKYGITEQVRFATEVVSARYTDGHWQLLTRTANGTEQRLSAPVLISAVGQLNRPSVPDFPGKEKFTGPAFHPTLWDHSLDLAGLRLGVIGTGASAMQLAPAIAGEVGQLKIFQRSAQWMRILPDYHKNVGPGKSWLLKHIPYYRSWYRFKLSWHYGDDVWQSLHSDPDWPHPERSLNAVNERHRRIYIANMTRALGGDTELLRKAIPDYPVFGKRMLIDNHWCAMLQRDNVDLIPHGVAQITEHGLTDTAGVSHELDAIVYATGFKAGQFLWPMDIRGKSGHSLAEIWGENPRAYLGMTIPDFPNLFVMYGPNTNVGHGGSTIFYAECQARYICRCLLQMASGGKRQMEVKQHIHDDYNHTVDGMHRQMVWSHPGVSSWYTNSAGRVVANTPWRSVDYWRLTFRPNPEDFHWQ